MNRKNHLDQPIGAPLENQKAAIYPPYTTMQGRYCDLVPLVPKKHAAQLYDVFSRDTTDANWTYLLKGPFDSFEAFNGWLIEATSTKDPLFYVVKDKSTEQCVGIASYLRINPKFGVIEVGHIHFSPLLQRTPMATEAMYLMMKHVFDDLGYRRYEWKCDSLNEKSRNAAVRFGFTFEGIFRQALFYKNRNRDTAWYSVIDNEWAKIKKGFQAWLEPANFDKDGTQKRNLRELTK